MYKIKYFTIFVILLLCNKLYAQKNQNIDSLSILRLDTLKMIDHSEMQYYSWINDTLNGMEGFTPNNTFIFHYPVSKNFPGEGNDGNWFPVDGYKHILRGRLVEFYYHKGATNLGLGHERDWNLLIKPHNQFQYLIDYNKVRFNNRKEWHRENSLDTNYFIECEVTPSWKLVYNNDNFIVTDRKKRNLWEFLGDDETYHGKTNVGDELFLYGPWVTEKAHCNRPELHPTEIIWWQNKKVQNKNYSILAVKDASRYFQGKSSYSFPIDINLDDLAEWKPWNTDFLDFQFNISVNCKLDSTTKVLITPTLFNEGNILQNVQAIENRESNVYVKFGNKIICEVELRYPLRKFLNINISDFRMMNDSTAIGYISVSLRLFNEGHIFYNIDISKTKSIDIDEKRLKPYSYKSVNSIKDKRLLNTRKKQERFLVGMFRSLSIHAGKTEEFGENAYMITNVVPMQTNTVNLQDKEVIKYMVVRNHLANKYDSEGTFGFDKVSKLSYFFK